MRIEEGKEVSGKMSSMRDLLFVVGAKKMT